MAYTALDFNLTTLILFIGVFSLGAMSGYFSERVGIVNISVNGQMIFGALFFTIVAFSMKNSSSVFSEGKNFEYSLILPLVVAGIATIPVGLLFGFLTIKLKTDQMIAGTAINLLATGVASFVCNPIAKSITNYQKTSLTSDFRGFLEVYDKNGQPIFYFSALIILIAIILIIFAFYFMMKKTPFGLRLYAIGENPNAADAQGINVHKYQWIAIMISSIFAGFAGGLFMYQRGAAFYGTVDGIGFLSIAILIAGGWKIPLIIIMSIVFASIKNIIPGLVKNEHYTHIIKIIPYMITMIGMIAFARYSNAPKNAGIPFDKTKR
ncbi:ABC transporter permease [Ureaplasma miroungigenitalium]|uniref:ABC transporter permease n=1 Tax=Ureaplasma miroungigenitalium TaxID=1042321 RepID=A0ABT3BMH3_9BACT|nr:ABC transporter permease [Ureaplasma miroungigenitalium]MCV3728450.1 ABC transporter permease [Ureaplasma miroungigenitalium]MCV3734237.1 ABC transporter permease [Ureaplasma miroungigenitalium]